MTAKQLAKRMEHTFLKPEAVKKDIERLCSEAAENSFYGVCVNSSWVETAKKALEHTDVRIVTVAGFPLGAASPAAKLAEIDQAVEDGADEADMVLNIGKLKDGEFGFLEKEIRHMKNSGDFILKVIVETCLLTLEEKKAACKVVLDSGADFIKTSTGFSTAGAKVEDVRLFREIAGDRLRIKASGGIADMKTALAMIEAGADRLGTSRSMAILKEAGGKNG